MTIHEACAFLNCDEDELDDSFEFALFEWKKNILQKPLLKLTLKSKLKSLDKLIEVHELLYSVLNQNESINVIFPQHGLTILEQVEKYSKLMSEYKTSFFNELNPLQLKIWIEKALEIERWNALFYESSHDEWTAEDPIFGKLMDEVLYLKNLKEQQSLGRINLEQLNAVKEELPTQLRLDLKRLSLLSKYL